MSEDEPEDKEVAAWLLTRERGQLDHPVSAATAARYAQLQSMITDLPAMPAGVTPRAGWQQDVLAAIDAAEAGTPSTPAPVLPIEGATDSVTPKRTRARPRRWGAATAIFAIAAVVALLFVVYRYRGTSDGPGAGPTIAFEVELASRPNRTPDPSVGDTLIVRGVVEGIGELRVYDDAGVETAHCTVPAPDCTVDRAGKRTTLRTTMPLRVPGALRAVLFTAPVGRPSGGLDADVEAAMRAGIAVTPRDLVDVH